MQVVNLAQYRSREVIAALRELLEAAEAGEIRGLAYVVKVAPGDNRVGLAGVYKQCPEKALKAAFKLEKELREPLVDMM